MSGPAVDEARTFSPLPPKSAVYATASGTLKVISLLFVFLWTVESVSAGTGRLPAEFGADVSIESNAILRSHGLDAAESFIDEDGGLKARDVPAEEDAYIFRAYRDNFFSLRLYNGREIPDQAFLDLIAMCLEFRAEREAVDGCRIVVYQENHLEWRNSRFLGLFPSRFKPMLEFHIGGEQ
ncbi:hypothetical protein [Thioalkalivibrio sp. AKL17]|uniref:hypothetical protein n=1 Tax=Thioalkalivibrio sp. AKL17 TaxID=1158160 RepID=UPI0003754CFD|nr:hypothetical protein [Thioalkalivibrio sp. AKL17]